MLFPEIESFCKELSHHFDTIPPERKQVLETISDYIRKKRKKEELIQMMYVCTHNSRRSHFGQVWAAVGSVFYNISNVQTFSGGTEATAFNPNAIGALERIGFRITSDVNTVNPFYNVQFGENEHTICFSKIYDHPHNPSTGFVAIMTCSDAEDNCPFIPGVDLRIATTYDDPKAFDNTPLQDSKYDERCRQVALETMYVFSLTR